MKKIVSLILLLAICLTLAPYAAAESQSSAAAKFTDVPTDAWYCEELDYALANGFINGTSDSTFSPSDNITRGQSVTIFGRMLKANILNGNASTSFTDVSTVSYYAPYVSWAAQNGYVHGTSSSTFAPNDLITFEQMGVILANYISNTGAKLNEVSDAGEYKDAASISAYAVDSMEAMRKYGLITPDSSGNVNPQRPVNRAEGTVSLVRLAKALGLEKNNAAEPTPPTATAAKTTYESLIIGDPQLISLHDPYDMEAVDNNIGYMLKHGMSEIQLETNMSLSDMESKYRNAYSDSYMTGIKHFEEYGYNYVSVQMSSTGGSNFFDDFFNDEPTIVVGPQTKIKIRFGNEYFSDEEMSKYRADALAAAIKVHDEMWSSGAITSAMTQKEKAKVYYDWLVKKCDYDWGFSHISFVPYGSLINGKAVCEGYTGAYNLLLKLEGIDCSTELTSTHIWTTANLDGVFCHIDATWGDQNSVPADQFFAMSPEVSWARFK